MKAITGLIALLFTCTACLAIAGGLLIQPCSEARLDRPNESKIQINTTINSNDWNRPAFDTVMFKYDGDISDGDSLVLFAGNDTTICLDGYYISVSGVSQNFYYTSWATAGDGFFAQATSLITQYFPGTEDKLNGLADLYLVGICVEPDYLRIVDSVKITLVPAPNSFAGIDESICSGDVFQTNPDVSNYSALIWSTTGDGTFDYMNGIAPSYYHGSQDLIAGEVSLSLTAFPFSPCAASVTNTMTLYINQAPEVFAGNDTIICEGESLQLDATVQNSEGTFWITNGDGTFSDISVINPVYTPGPSDISSGGAILSVFVASDYPCQPWIFDNVALTIVRTPLVIIGPDQTICETENVQCTALVENHKTIEWSVLGGNGYFDDPSAMNPVYFPGNHEKNTGVFFLVLTVSSSDPCTSSINAFFKVTLASQAFISAGADRQICSTDTAMFFGIGENYTDITWATSGDGTFTGGQNISKLYTPGPGDIESGSTEIYLCASSVQPCTNLVCDTVMLQIQKSPVAYAGEDLTTCAEVDLNGVATNYQEISWTTTGDGTFDDFGLPNPTYFAGESDIQNTTVTLSFYAESMAPCYGTISDEIIITIDKPVLINSTSQEQEIITGEPIILITEATSFQDISYQWYHNDNPIENATWPQLEISSGQPVNAGDYYCLFGNECFIFSGDTVRITVLDPANQLLELSSGWNAISSYVTPATADIESLLNPIIDDLIVLYSSEGIYFPGQDLQEFNFWNTDLGYIMKNTASGSLLISGYIKYPIEEITLEPGWSVLPMQIQCSMNVEGVFAGYPEIKAIKEIGGYRIYWPEKDIITLQNISPGKAYEVFNASNEVIIFTFPACEE